MITLEIKRGCEKAVLEVSPVSGVFSSAAKMMKEMPQTKFVKPDTWLVPLIDCRILARQARMSGVKLKFHPSAMEEIEKFNSFREYWFERAAEKDREVIFPFGMRRELAPYQKVAVAYLTDRKLAILGDDIGTRKTANSLIAAWKLIREGKARNCLIVCPKSVKAHWPKEAEKQFTEMPRMVNVELDSSWSPKCPIGLAKRFSGKNRKPCRDCAQMNECAKKRDAMRNPSVFRSALWKQDADFHIANYETVRDDSWDEKTDGYRSPKQFDIVIVDEVHRIRTKNTDTARALFAVAKEAKYRWGVSGTPLQNRLEDLWSVMQFVNPKIFGSFWNYRQRYIITDHWGKAIKTQNADEVKEKLGLVMLRRLADDVIGLPPVSFNDYLIELGPRQRKFYEEAREKLLSIPGDPDMDRKIKQANILAQLTYLRETCDSTELIDPEVKESTKLSEMKDILSDIGDERKVLIFSQWERMTRIIERELKGSAVRFHGGMNTKERQASLARFQADSKTRYMILTTAGGEGVDGLQVADTLVLFDLLFNPRAMDQIVGRIKRSGQKAKKLHVVRLISKNTIEERVVDILAEKDDLFETIVDDHKLAGNFNAIKRLLTEK